MTPPSTPSPNHNANKHETANGEAGLIVIKENISTDPGGRDMYDPVDSSVTRTEKKWEALFEGEGLEVVRGERARGFGDGGLGMGLEIDGKGRRLGVRLGGD